MSTAEIAARDPTDEGRTGEEKMKHLLVEFKIKICNEEEIFFEKIAGSTRIK